MKIEKKLLTVKDLKEFIKNIDENLFVVPFGDCRHLVGPPFRKIEFVIKPKAWWSRDIIILHSDDSEEDAIKKAEDEYKAEMEELSNGVGDEQKNS